jgi:hypothetical protein
MIKGFIKLEFWRPKKEFFNDNLDFFNYDLRQKTYDLVKSFEVENLITYAGYRSILGDTPNSIFNSSEVFVSDSQAAPNPNTSTLNILAEGVPPTTGNEYVIFPDLDPPFCEVQNVINPPVSGTRTIWSVGLKNKNTSAAIAYTKLDIPCDQDSSTFITIFYRWQFEDSANVAGKMFNGALFKKNYVQAVYSGLSGFSTDRGAICPFDLNNSDRDYLFDSGNYNNLLIVGASDSNQVWSGTTVSAFFKRKLSKSSGTNKNILVGHVFRGLLYPRNGVQNTYHGFSRFEKSGEPINPIFCHRGTEQVPFFDPAAFGLSQGKIAFTGNWTGKIPTFLQVLITKSGAVGVAEYRYQMRRTLGWSGNTYGRLVLPNLWKHPSFAPYPKAHGWQQASNDVLVYSKTQVIFYDTDGVSLVDVYDGAHLDWDVSTSPSVAVSNIAQVATDGSKVYVACRNTGFWIIDVATNTVTRPVTEPSYGVDVGRGGRVWVVTQGGVRTSLNNYGAALALNFADLNGNWQRAYYIKCDPEHPNDRCAVVYDRSGTVTICWIAGSTLVCTLGAGGRCGSYPASLDVSDTGGFWAGWSSSNASSGLTFASTGSQSLNGIPANNSRAKVAFIGANAITIDSLRNSSNAVVTSYTSLGGSTNFVVHLGDGLVIMETALAHLFTTAADGWTGYGWNGSAWVEGNTTSKVTHSDAQDILEGLKIQWTNGTATPHFEAGERFNVPVSWGLWKDNITTFSFEAAWYSKDVKFDEPVNAPIPASAPYKIHLSAGDRADFYALETDSLGLFDIKIDGISPTEKKISPAVPAPGEMAIDVANKDLIFNAADANKLVTGVYAWLKA